MTDKTHTSYASYPSYRSYPHKPNLIPPHGGYRKLLSYQMAEIIYDLTVMFCKKYLDPKSRTNDQMIQAARSGVQNIAEGSQASGTSKKTELKLIGVARASLEELLRDYEDFLRQRGLHLWNKNTPQVRTIRELSYRTDKTHRTYMTYMTNQEVAANCLICLLHQTNYLLDKLLLRLEEDFVKNGGFTERLYTIRKNTR
jgi:restriction system protein